MTEEPFYQTFWHWSPEKNWPPYSTTHIKDIKPSDKLNLAITQTSFPASLQKKFVSVWCEKLPQLQEVKYLWFTSRVNQEMFDAACEMQSLEGLYIKWSGVKDIGKIANLKNIKSLHIGSSTQIEDISPLANLGKLQVLELINLQRIQDYSIIKNLTELRELAITGDVRAPKTLKIESLQPLRGLGKLRHLDLDCTRIMDDSYEHLLELSELESLWISRKIKCNVRSELNKRLTRLIKEI